MKYPLSRNHVANLRRESERRIIDLGPFGGCEMLVRHTDMVVSREVVRDLCNMAMLLIKQEE